MPHRQVNDNYIFTEGEVLSFYMDYQVPVAEGMATMANVRIKARHALSQDEFEFKILNLKFSAIQSLALKEQFNVRNKIKNMTLTRLNNGLFYIALRPHNESNTPHELDDFVIQARDFSFTIE